MTADRRDTDDLKALAESRLGDVLGGLGFSSRARPSGPKGRILIESPMIKQNTPSFNVYTRGSGIGFYDFATGEGGDVFALVAAFRGWWHLPDHGFLEAKRWLEDRLGVRTLSAAEKKRDAEAARKRRARAERDAEAERARNIGRAQQMFYNALPLHGTLAETYLRARGLDLDGLPRGPRGGVPRLGSLRFIAREPHRDERGCESEWPCLIACCVDPATGDVRAVHRTWLAPSGADKAPVDAPRKCWPEVGGLIIPLWRGESRLSVPAAIANGLRETVVLAEGIETALSAVLAAPQFRTWAAVSLGNLARLALPECIDSVMLCRENDWVKPQAVAQFTAGKAALERQGRPVAEIPAYGGNDLNDVLRGAA